MIYTPRPYQRDAIDAGLAYLQDSTLKGRNGLVVAPTGSGKSIVIASARRTRTSASGPCSCGIIH